MAVGWGESLGLKGREDLAFYLAYTPCVAHDTKNPAFFLRGCWSPTKTKKGSVAILFRRNTTLPLFMLAFAYTVAPIIVTSSRLTLIETRIGTHNHNVANSTPPAYCKVCLAACTLRRKDFRRRGLRYLSACHVTNQPIVVRQAIVLVRWQCKSCKFTFTDYPDFRTPL